MPSGGCVPRLGFDLASKADVLEALGDQLGSVKWRGAIRQKVGVIDGVELFVCQWHGPMLVRPGWVLICEVDPFGGGRA